jgi:hypothetical protein
MTICCHAESSSRPTSTGCIENVHGSGITITCSYICATHQHSSPAPQSAPPSAQHMPPNSHITPSCNINNSKNKIKYAPLVWPPPNMANPWFGSDVAARLVFATLRAAVVQAAGNGHCPGCAAAMLMKHSITATATAAVWLHHVAELGRVLVRSVRVGCSCASAVARSPRIAVFSFACERCFVIRARLVDPMAGCGRVGICR